MKYIIVETPDGFDTPIIFPDWISHNEMKVKIPGKVVSAGFITKDDSGNLVCSGHSVTLGISSREEDSNIISTMMSYRF